MIRGKFVTLKIYVGKKARIKDIWNKHLTELKNNKIKVEGINTDKSKNEWIRKITIGLIMIINKT